MNNEYYDYKMLCKTLKYLRMKNKLTQSKLALHVGISASTVSSHENGRSIPEIYTIFAYCKAYKITMMEFFHMVSLTVDNATPIVITSDITKEAAIFSLS